MSGSYLLRAPLRPSASATADPRETLDAIPWNGESGIALPDASAAQIDAGELLDGLDDAEATFALIECRRALRESGVLHLRCAPPAPPRFDFSIGASLHRAGPRGPEATVRLARRAGLEPAGPESARTSERDAAAASFVRPVRALEAEPLVSVLIPAYSPRYFRLALDSALAQSYPRIEVVVCDDSEGGEIEALVRAAGTERPVRYLRNVPRLRTRGNYNRCLREARGALVKLLNDDDELAEHAVERMAEALVAHPGAVLAFSSRARIDAAGTTLEDMPATVPVADRDLEIRGWTLANAMLMAGLNFIGEPTTVMFRRDDALRDLRDGDAFHFEGEAGLGVVDMAIFSRLLLSGDAVFLADRLSRFRWHAGQAQQDPKVVAMGVQSIRSLQAIWMRLGLHRFVPYGGVLARPAGAASEPYRWTEVEPVARLPGHR